jgi:hypothetical protein
VVYLVITFKQLTTHDDLQEYFPLLEEGCKRISRTQGFTTFAPDIYHALLQGKVEMVVGFRDGVAKGFFVHHTVQPAIGPAHFYVWLGFIRSGDPEDGIVAAFNEIERIAAERGCSQIVFTTRRRGWGKLAERVGMRLRDYTFFKGVGQ